MAARCRSTFSRNASVRGSRARLEVANSLAFRLLNPFHAIEECAASSSATCWRLCGSIGNNPKGIIHVAQIRSDHVSSRNAHHCAARERWRRNGGASAGPSAPIQLRRATAASGGLLRSATGSRSGSSVCVFRAALPLLWISSIRRTAESLARRRSPLALSGESS